MIARAVLILALALSAACGESVESTSPDAERASPAQAADAASNTEAPSSEYEILSAEEAERQFGIERPTEVPPEEVAYPDALQPLVARAKQGNADAQYELAQALRRGLTPGQVWMMHDESPRGATTNYDRSKNHFVVTRWFKAAAAQGHAGAQYELGQRYLEGWGVEPSFKDAETNLRAAEEGEFDEAEYIGDWLDSVKGTAKATGDHALPHAIWVYESRRRDAALGEFVALAEHGDDPVERVVAAYFAGLINFWGYEEAPPNHEFSKEALKWYRQAAEGGYVWAQLGLGEFYSGWGACDREEARFWYQAAANQHWEGGRAKLAEMESPDWTFWSCNENTVRNE